MVAALHELFPIPSLPPSTISPARLPGISPESTTALQQVLQDNHEKWHIFYNEKGFLNHIAHHVLANWALGANGRIIRAAYERATTSQRPALERSGSITAANFNQHFCDERYYPAYLEFAKTEIRSKGFAVVLEDWVFSIKANFVDEVDQPQPEMLSRFLASLLHPLIHVGYGLEFGLCGVLAEGLAQIPAHTAETSNLLPRLFFDRKYPPVPLSDGVHAFTVLARILKDPDFNLENVSIDRKNPMAAYQYVERHHADAIRNHAERWAFDVFDPKNLERKIEELVWVNTIIYAAPGWKQGRPFRADFFFMHFVTSSIFLSSIAAYLSPKSQELLLRAYFCVCITTFIARGRPNLDITSFFTETEEIPKPPHGSCARPSETALAGASADAALPNPWPSILLNSIVHPDDHLPKLQRALAHYSAIYGSRHAGLPDFTSTELAGADKLDGSLFVRVAELTATSLGRVYDGEEKTGAWVRKDFIGE
ncbi:hypothetical protein HGRIS_014383 [Hohenbuehelia grisea]|uniref:Uncharacterized protein n=1 Tax=Hohenbuehelia grisea TaxID=104357 RepID=A0ABR3JUP1_9AGAR